MFRRFCFPPPRSCRLITLLSFYALTGEFYSSKQSLTRPRQDGNSSYYDVRRCWSDRSHTGGRVYEFRSRCVERQYSRVVSSSAVPLDSKILLLSLSFLAIPRIQMAHSLMASIETECIE